MFKILIVEDDKDLNKTVCSFLNHSGYEAIGCLNANDAYDALADNIIDLIVSDIMLPGTDGFEFATNVRELNEEILQTAKRELCEETGALQFDISPICVYSVTGKNRVNETGEETYGMLFFANIRTFENELHSEMESVSFFEVLPTEWTYPLIQPLLIQEYLRRTDAM